MKKILIAASFLLLPALAQAKCVNGTSYTLKGYFENSNNDPVTGKTLSEVKFDFFYDDGTSSTGNNATAEMGQGWYRYSYTSNGKSGVWVVRDSTGSYKNFPGGFLESICDSQDPAAVVSAIWGQTLPGAYGAGTAGYNLDAPVSSAGSGSITVTAASGNASTWRIPIDETSVITANDQYIGKKLMCNKELREIVDTVQGTPDLIIIEPGNPYSAAPDDVACTVE